MQYHTQVDIITTNLNIKMYFTLPEMSAAKIVMQKYHVDDSAKDRYDIILGRDLITALVLNLKFSVRIIEAYDGPLKGSTSLIVDLSAF